jgi:hypothetical protein
MPWDSHARKPIRGNEFTSRISICHRLPGLHFVAQVSEPNTPLSMAITL